MGTPSISLGLGRLALGLLIAAAILGPTGCAVDKTAWLRHIEAPTVAPASTEAEQLAQEIRRPLKRHTYTPAEQIAAYAAHELQSGNEWDAALLLTIASYRYHQQALMALAIGREQSSTIVPQMRPTFYEWVEHEVGAFNQLHFDSEVDLVRQRLFGLAIASERHDEYIETLAKGGKEDDSFAQRLSDFHIEMSNRPERLAHHQLADAFLARLLRSHERDRKNNFAFYYLAATPLDSFRLAALDHTKAPFSGPLARNMVPRMRTLREQVKVRLDSPRANTRAMAAAILGLSPDPADVALLEAMLEHEAHSVVIDSIRFALIRNGQEKHLAHLVDRAGQKLIRSERDHALTMLLWLPLETKAKLDETRFIQLARKYSAASTFGRSIALFILRDIASQRTLGQKSVRTLLTFTANQDKEVANAASRVVSGLAQLSAAECKTLYPKHPKARAALISRLGEVAALGDLAFLGHAYETSGNVDVQIATVAAVATIPGTASLQLLKRWLIGATGDENSAVFMMLVAMLASRADVDQAGLDELKLSGPKRLMIQMALDRRFAATGVTSLDHLGIQDALQIALLSGIFQRPDVVPTLWMLARYRNDQFYPGDAVVRRHAMGALVRIELQRLAERSARPQAAL